MAAKKEGTSLAKVQQAKTRGQLLACEAQVVRSDREENGDLVEVYQIPKERGSIARALLHGILDLNTLFLWEIIGTPIEGSLNKKEFFSIKVHYDQDEVVQKVEIL